MPLPTAINERTSKPQTERGRSASTDTRHDLKDTQCMTGEPQVPSRPALEQQAGDMRCEKRGRPQTSHPDSRLQSNADVALAIEVAP